jgi:hypothetical protein
MLADTERSTDSEIVVHRKLFVDMKLSADTKISVDEDAYPKSSWSKIFRSEIQTILLLFAFGTTWPSTAESSQCGPKCSLFE